MITLRPAAERGHADHGWLDTKHTFSFARYHDPAHMGFRSLRVINEDRVRGGGGFGSHPHRDMEIITYVLDGALEHRDSLGHGAVLRPRELQRITAGTGIVHSEFNHSQDEPVHFLQIWIEPSAPGLKPSYEQRAFDPGDVGSGSPGLRLVASPDGADGSLTINQDARIYLARWAAGESLDHRLAPDRHAWLQVTRGHARVGDETLTAGDGLAISGETSVTIEGSEAGEALLFDLA